MATPLNTACSGANPARSAFHSSPPEFTSTPTPACLTLSSTQSALQALLAKNTSVAVWYLVKAARRASQFSAMRLPLKR